MMIKTIKQLLLVAILFGLFNQVGCTNQKTNLKERPSWTYKSVKTGIVCSQPRGIMTISDAEDMAINSCAIQKSAKNISGSSDVVQSTDSVKVNGKEYVKVKSSVKNNFIVESVKGSQVIKVEVKDKYYYSPTQTVYVWIN